MTLPGAVAGICVGAGSQQSQQQSQSQPSQHPSQSLQPHPHPQSSLVFVLNAMALLLGKTRVLSV
jgi:hypothetical protein